LTWQSRRRHERNADNNNYYKFRLCSVVAHNPAGPRYPPATRAVYTNTRPSYFYECVCLCTALSALVVVLLRANLIDARAINTHFYYTADGRIIYNNTMSILARWNGNGARPRGPICPYDVDYTIGTCRNTREICMHHAPSKLLCRRLMFLYW